MTRVGERIGGMGSEFPLERCKGSVPLPVHHAKDKSKSKSKLRVGGMQRRGKIGMCKGINVKARLVALLILDARCGLAAGEHAS